MNSPNPLLTFFDGLRKAGLTLDIDALLLLLKALEGGFGIENVAAFERLCQVLWVKSEEDEVLLKRQLVLLEHELLKHLDRLDEAVKRLRASLAAQMQADQITSRLETETLTPAIPRVENPTHSPDISTSFGIDNNSLQLPHALPIQETGQQIRDAPTDADATVEYSLKEHIFRAVHAPEEIEALLSMEVPFNLNDYLPVSRRQMKQSWRYLRRMARGGPASELNLESTIARYVRTGLELEPVFVPRRINHASLLLCVDHQGSMVPFHGLGQRLVETAMAGGRLCAADIYYFRNWPDEWLFHDPGHIEATPLTEALAHIDPNATSVVIFSDAGAARGGFNQDRINGTRRFLCSVWQRTAHVCWLNPLPKQRWKNTSADNISKFSPMVEVNRRGMEEMIRYLRGNRPHSAIISPWAGSQ